MLRNNFAKRFLMTGGDIYTLSRILGHSSVKVTEKAYLDLDEDDSCSLVGRNAQQQEFDYDFFDFENARINSNLGQQKAILEINK